MTIYLLCQVRVNRVRQGTRKEDSSYREAINDDYLMSPYPGKGIAFITVSQDEDVRGIAYTFKA